MAEQNEMHFEVIDSNKQKAHKERVAMKEELVKFVVDSNSYDLHKMYEQMRKLRKGDK